MFSYRESIDLGRAITGQRYRTEYQALKAVQEVLKRDPLTGLRFHKSTVTFANDWRRFNEINLIDGNQSDAIEAINRCHARVEAICNLHIVEAPIEVADTINQFVDVDGPGGVLAFVPQPVNGDNMAVCEGCGSVYFDVEKTCRISDFANIYQHELVHRFGIGHGPDWSIAAPFYMFGTPEQELDNWTISEYVTRYGVRR